MNLRFSGTGLAFLSHFVATRDIRYYLNGVYLQPMTAEAGGGVLGAATNGHALGMWRDTEGHVDRPIIITVSRGLASACARKENTLLVARDNHLVCTWQNPAPVEPEIELFVQPNAPLRRAISQNTAPFEVEGTFPSVSKPVPLRTRVGPVNLINAQYLALMHKALPKRRFGQHVRLHQAEADRGILLTSPTAPQALAVIMPVRDDNLPESPWLERWKVDEARVAAVAAAPLPGRQPSDAVPPRD